MNLQPLNYVKHGTLKSLMENKIKYSRYVKSRISRADKRSIR